jgi:two-component system response regulator LytT
MLSVLIIEDEVPNATRLKRMLMAIDKNNIQVVGQLQSIQSSIDWLTRHEHPDIICMDIRLTDGLSFELFNQVQVRSNIIFVTAYDEYALRAFQVNAIDYLLKPVEMEKLESSIRKAKNRIGFVANAGMLDVLKKMQFQESVYRSRFLITYRDTYIPVLSGEVAYFSSENKISFLITHQAQRYIVEQTLEELEQELNPHDFFRISRQHIVSIKSIHKIRQSFNGKLQVDLIPAMAGSILVSKDKSLRLKSWLNGSF